MLCLSVINNMDEKAKQEYILRDSKKKFVFNLYHKSQNLTIL